MFFLLCLSFLPLEKIGIYLDAYYLPHLRMIELLTGSLLAVILCLKGNHLSPKASNILGISTFYNNYSLLVYQRHFCSSLFPRGNFILVVCPYSATNCSQWKRKLCKKNYFQLPPIVWIGKLSYLYTYGLGYISQLCRYFLGVGDLPFWGLL